MNNQEQIDAGLDILQEYQDNFVSTGDEDYIYACNLHPVDMDIDDIEHLTELNWHWDDDAWMWKHRI